MTDMTDDEFDEHIIKTVAAMSEFIDAILSTPEGRAATEYARTKYGEPNLNGHAPNTAHWYSHDGQLANGLQTVINKTETTKQIHRCGEQP